MLIKLTVGLVFLVSMVLVVLYLIGESFLKAVEQDENDRER